MDGNLLSLMDFLTGCFTSWSVATLCKKYASHTLHSERKCLVTLQPEEGDSFFIFFGRTFDLVSEWHASAHASCHTLCVEYKGRAEYDRLPGRLWL